MPITFILRTLTAAGIIVIVLKVLTMIPQQTGDITSTLVILVALLVCILFAIICCEYICHSLSKSSGDSES